MLDAPGTASLPDHVPPELVRPYPYVWGAVTEGDPFAPVAEIHRWPEVFYSLDAYPGGTPAWVVRRTADLRKMYFDTDHFSNKDFAPFAKLIGETWSELPAETDPPMHQHYRAFVNPIFTPKAMTKLEGKIRQYAQDYISVFRDRGNCEFMSEFAFEFPIKVFLELMGLPLGLTKEFMAWEVQLIHGKSMEDVRLATRAVVDYLRGEIADRRANPTDDLITYGVQGKVDGRPLTDDELVGFTFNLFIGGLDTVSTNMGLHFRHLAEHPDHQNRLRAEPAMIPAAIDELMRAYPAVTTFRTCVKETEINGVRIKIGDRVAMPTTLAGRDPEEYERPDEVILDRDARHLGFAYGPHLCVGMHLARREMRIAMEEFLAMIPEFRLRPGTRIVSQLSGMIQPDHLPFIWQV
jgi:cytochrome P450